MSTAKKSIATETMDTAMNLTEKTANVTLQGAVQTAEVTESYVQGMYKAAYDANVDALKVAKNYWDATSEIRQDWIKLFSTAGESFIKAAGNMELPFQKTVADFGKSIVTNVEQTVENLGKQAKQATK